MIKRLKVYLIPSGIAVALLVLLACGWPRIAKFCFSPADLAPLGDEIVELPHGRVFYAVVEKEGVYVGDSFIAVQDFESYLRKERDALRADYIVVSATQNAKYGDVAIVYTLANGILRVPGTIRTNKVSPGTRWPVIATREHFWEY